MCKPYSHWSYWLMQMLGKFGGKTKHIFSAPPPVYKTFLCHWRGSPIKTSAVRHRKITCGRLNSLLQKFNFCENFVVSARTREEGVRQCGQGKESNFFCNFVRASFMDSRNRRIKMKQTIVQPTPKRADINDGEHNY